MRPGRSTADVLKPWPLWRGLQLIAGQPSSAGPPRNGAGAYRKIKTPPLCSRSCTSTEAMARELLLIRHGIAVERGSTATDEERALTAEGRARTRKVLQRLEKWI